MIEAIDTRTWTMIAAGVVLVAVARGARFYMRKRKSPKDGDRLPFLPLSSSETARFSEAWRSLQKRFIDNPRWTIAEADLLARELMKKRGCPMDDFERRAADIAVDHPDVVANYRSARDIALSDQRGTANTADLHEAVAHYGALFDALLAVKRPKRGAGKKERAELEEERAKTV
ncbi:MAG TPA: hypothetical protein VGL70_06075 [Candidatus Binatia bacterium]|jgi:hypothetical protein